MEKGRPLHVRLFMCVFVHVCVDMYIVIQVFYEKIILWDDALVTFWFIS